MAWLLGERPPGLPDWVLQLYPPHQPTLPMLVYFSKSAWPPLHSLLRVAGGIAHQLPQMQESEKAGAQHTVEQLLWLCKLWILAVERLQPGLLAMGQLLRHPTSSIYWEYQCHVLLEHVLDDVQREEPRLSGIGRPTVASAKGEYMDVGLQALLVTLSLGGEV